MKIGSHGATSCPHPGNREYGKDERRSFLNLFD